jgi:hypothetical protein
MKKNAALIALSLLILYAMLISKAVAWENKLTHPELTQIAVERSVLVKSDYLQTQFGLVQGLNTKLELMWNFESNLQRRASQERPPEAWGGSELSIEDWIKDGSYFEDVPNPRARHHFHDPIRNTGLNNFISSWTPVIILASKWLYPDYWAFNLEGGSAIKRALGCADDWGVWWESEPEYAKGGYNWPNARLYFYNAITVRSEDERKKWLATAFVMLGHVCHLLEDMGVPAHTRNDFVKGHMVGGLYTDITGAKQPWWSGGHPFEGWMEKQILNNGGAIPNVYLARLMTTPPVFARFKDYFDTDICELSGITQWQGDSPGWPGTGFGNPPPEKDWGLSECTNYQFFSYSTINGDPFMRQSFPHPAEGHTRVDWYLTGPGGSKQYYRVGYEVPHLDRSTFTNYIANHVGMPLSVNSETTEENHVYEDYAKRTIPRTIDYTTGLINYFFRGRLSVQQIETCCTHAVIRITNISEDSSVGQSLKGGMFELYYDDPAGNRAKVTDFTVFEPAPSNNQWNSASTLAYNQSTEAIFAIPEAEVAKYILVYKGNICQNPADPDPDDQGKAIATAIFDAVGCESIPNYMCAVWSDSAGSVTSCAALNKDLANCCWTGTFEGGTKDGQSVVLTCHAGGWHGWYGSSSCDYSNDPVSGKTWSKSLSCNGGTVQLTNNSTGAWEKVSFTPTDIPVNCCEPTGACCDFSTGNCTIKTEANCSYTWLGADVSCDECHEIGIPCSSCPIPNKTPKYLDLVLDGLTLCTGCDNDQWGSAAWVGSAPNGTYRLTQDIYNGCSWSASGIPCGITIEYYDYTDVPCAGARFAVQYFHLDISVSRGVSNGGIYVIARSNTIPDTGDTGHVFSASFTPDSGKCMSVAGVNNTYIAPCRTGHYILKCCIGGIASIHED